MATKLRMLRLEGPVTVVYRKEDGVWCAIALEFDLVGTGSTKDEAFQALLDVFDIYVSEILKEKKPVQFENPSPPEDWALEHKDRYYVTVLIEAMPRRGPVRMRDLRREGKKPRQVSLVPA